MKKFRILNVPIKKLKAARYNPRKISDREMKKLKQSIQEYGLVQNIVINHDNTIIGGHQRVQACAELGMFEVPCVQLTLSPEKERALNIALNKIGGDFDNQKLVEVLTDIEAREKDLVTGYEDIEIQRLLFKEGRNETMSLVEEFIVPPFSIFDTKQNYWQERKKEWLKKIGERKMGRENLLGGSALEKAGTPSGEKLGGVSAFDPVLLEVLYKWFVPRGGLILDPFAGGPTGGLVASMLDYNYIGIDLWAEQVERNRKKAKELGEKKCKWVCDNATNLNEHATDVDAIVTCPPYFDLEVYQKDNAHDLSAAKSYPRFLEMYAAIIYAMYRCVKKDGWVIIVIGNVRDEEGNYYNLVGDTVMAMQKSGFRFYNEIILATALGTAPLRARNYMRTKKIVKAHQNILFFRKGQNIAVSGALKEIIDTGMSATAHHDILIFRK